MCGAITTVVFVAGGSGEACWRMAADAAVVSMAQARRIWVELFAIVGVRKLDSASAIVASEAAQPSPKRVSLTKLATGSRPSPSEAIARTKAAAEGPKRWLAS